MEQVVACLSKCEDYTVFLFGGRGYEEAILEQWEFQYPRVKSVVGKYALDNELALISNWMCYCVWILQICILPLW